MKRTILAALIIMMCAMAVPGGAEVIEITYEGTYVEFDELGIQVYLPNDWLLWEDEAHYLSISDWDETQWMSMDVIEAGGETLGQIAEEVAGQDGFDSVSFSTINGIQFATYEAAVHSSFGAFMKTPDDAYCVHFIFAPHGDEALMDLATQLIASVSLL